MPERRGSTIIENVQPQLDCGRYPVKRVAGEPLRVTADIFKEGHDVLAAVVRWRQADPGPERSRARCRCASSGTTPGRPSSRSPPTASTPSPSRPGRTPSGPGCTSCSARWTVGRDVTSELLEGAALLDAAAARAEARTGRAPTRNASPGAEGAARRSGAGRRWPTASTRDWSPPHRATRTGPSPRRYRPRAARLRRARARACSAPGTSSSPARPPAIPRATAPSATRRSWLPYVASWASTSLYLPPIHPIGRTARKGKNNALTAGCRRRRQPLGHRRPARAATRPCTPSWERWRTSATSSSAAREHRAWRSRSTSPSSARRTIPT